MTHMRPVFMALTPWFPDTTRGQYVLGAVPWPLSRGHPHTVNQDRGQVWRSSAQQ